MDHAKLLDALTSLPVSQSILPRAVCFATSCSANHAICSFIDSSIYASGPIRRCLFIDYIIKADINHIIIFTSDWYHFYLFLIFIDFTDKYKIKSIILIIRRINMINEVYLFVRFNSLRPINNLSVIKGRVFLGQFYARINAQWRRWGSNPRPLGLKPSTLPLSHCAIAIF